MSMLCFVDPVSSGLEGLNKNKGCARATCLPLNGVVIGALKPFALPVISAVGCVVFPILAGISSCKGQRDQAKSYFRSWQFSVLTAACCFGFLMVTGFLLPPKASIGLVAGVVAISIALHIYRTERALT